MATGQSILIGQLKDSRIMTTTNKQTHGSQAIIRVLYLLSTAVGVYFLATGRPADAISSIGLALVFDPFNPAVTWKERPLYQKLIPLAHVAAVLVLALVLWI